MASTISSGTATGTAGGMWVNGTWYPYPSVAPYPSQTVQVRTTQYPDNQDIMNMLFQIMEILNRYDPIFRDYAETYKKLINNQDKQDV